jgi:hypothetical protein
MSLMRRLDSRLIYGGEDSGTFSMTYRPIFFVKIGRTANCPEPRIFSNARLHVSMKLTQL